MICNEDFRTPKAKQRTGAILPLTVIMLLFLIGMVAFAVDLGYLSLARTQIQAAADAGALGSAIALSDYDSSEARRLAQNAVGANKVAGSTVVLHPDDIEFGTWDSDSYEFTKLTGADESKANSVRVTCQRTSLRGNPIPLFFAPVFGSDFGEVSASAVALRGPICGALIGLESADLNGNQAYIDSYNSNAGNYNSQTPGSKGHLCSNGDIDVQNGVINGNATPGPGHEVEIGGGYVTGSTTPREDALTVPAVDFGNVATSNDNLNLPSGVYNASKQEFKHNGGGVVLPNGTFYFTNFSLNGGPVTVHGPVNIYVNGDFSVSGDGLLNTTHLPKNLQIFVEGRSVKLSGSAGFGGVVYAPSAHVEVAGSGTFYGAAVGRTLKFHNDGGVHVDESVLGAIPARSRLVD